MKDLSVQFIKHKYLYRRDDMTLTSGGWREKLPHINIKGGYSSHHIFPTHSNWIWCKWGYQSYQTLWMQDTRKFYLISYCKSRLPDVFSML